MPNGNTLILGWEYKSNEEALAKGRDPKSFPPSVFAGGKWHYGFWPDFVREVDKGGKTVWEWHAWDHIGKGPTKLDINYKLPEPIGDYYSNFDWTHFNTVDYNPKTDQVIVNSRNMSETMLIDHKTGQRSCGAGVIPALTVRASAPSSTTTGVNSFSGRIMRASWITETFRSSTTDRKDLKGTVHAL